MAIIRDWEAEVARLTAILRDPSYVAEHAAAPVDDTYARISKKISRNDEEKTVRQTARALQRVIDLGHRLGEILIDEARSAWKPNGKRPAFLRLVTRRLSGEADGAVVRYSNRVARQNWDCEQLIGQYPEERPYTVHTLKESVRLHVPDEADKLRNEVTAARKSSDEKSELSRGKVEDRLAAGSGKNGPAPFGHAWADEVPAVQLEAERSAVGWAVGHMLAGGSYLEVAIEWNRRGLSTRRGVAWHALNVRQCLLNPRHGGWLTYRGELYGRLADADIAIVDEVTWTRWQRMLQGRKRGRRVAATSPNFGAGTVRCDYCGRNLVGAKGRGFYPDGEPVRQYRCSPRGCGKVSIDARQLETWLGGRVWLALAHPDNRARLVSHDDERAALETEVRALEEAADGKQSLVDTAHPTRKAKHQADLLDLERQLSVKLDQLTALRAEVARTTVTARDVDEVRQQWVGADGPEANEVRRTMVREAFPDGLYVLPVGRGNRYVPLDERILTARTNNRVYVRTAKVDRAA